MHQAQYGGTRGAGFQGSCREYLEQVLPHLLDPRVPELAGRTAVVQVVVADQQDVDYTYTLDRDGVSVARGHSAAAALTLGFYSDELLAFANGTLDVARALRERRLQVSGDVELLSVLASALRI